MNTVTLANARRFEAASEVSLLDAAALHQVVLEHSCRTGRCGTCRARVLSGQTNLLLAETALADEERAAGWVLTCARAAASDVTLDIEDLSGLVGVQSRTLPCRIDRIERQAVDVVVVWLRLPPGNGFVFRAGQYIDLIGPGGFTRSYSIASPPDAAQIELHIREVPGGALSRYWFSVAKVNDLLRFRGPVGTFFLRGISGLDLTFLATGTGIAPVKSMLGEMRSMARADAPASVRVYWGGRQQDDLYWDLSASFSEVEFCPVLSRPDGRWTGAHGHVQDVMLAEVGALDNRVVYACGSEAMILSASAVLARAGLPAGRFRSDAFVSSS